MTEALWLGLLFGVGAALSVGPIFVTIVQESAARGFASGSRVILGSATADLLLLIPALAATSLVAAVAGASTIVAMMGATYFAYLAIEAARDGHRMWWRGIVPAATTGGWAFGKGAFGNLLSPSAWAFWIATGTPTMAHLYEVAGWPALGLFTVVWFVVAMGIEAAIALAAARMRHALGARTLALISVGAAGLLLARAVILVIQPSSG